MDGQLKKELKKLEHEYCYEDTIRIANYRKVSAHSRLEDGFPKSVRFDDDNLSILFVNDKKENFIKRMMNRLRNCSEPKLAMAKMILTDWLFLAILGISIGLLATCVDAFVSYIYEIQLACLSIANGWNDPSSFHYAVSFVSYVGLCVGMIMASATFVHYVSPQAIGSGVPEMKTILRGVILKDYLTVRTLISKVVGISLSYGSGVPIGKMGPFVHIASVLSNQMSKLAGWLEPTFNNDQRRTECLAAACAVGVACTFSAPIGGVLFSIEVTTMYFSVRSYWRGFFAACCGATTIRLCRGYLTAEEDEMVSINAFFQTSFAPGAYSAQELPAFAFLGLICGLIGALYINLYKQVVLFLRTNKYAKMIFQRKWYVYPIVISSLYSVITFRYGLGEFTTGRVKFSSNLNDFFTNCTFTVSPDSPLYCDKSVDPNWIVHPERTIRLLFTFILIVFSILCMSLPIPSGVFGPVFTLGAAVGRLYGELISLSVPHYTGRVPVFPGIYAVVGSASLSASVTHSVSVSMIILEITGQLHLILPVLISVVISNAVCAFIQPSFFDTIIKIKHLPFLPDIPPNNHIVHNTFAEDMMTSSVVSVTRKAKYASLKKLLLEHRHIRIFPLIESQETHMLLGTVSRRFLLEVLENQVGDIARKIEAEKRVRLAIQTIDQHFQKSKNEMTRRVPPRTRSAVSLSPDFQSTRKRASSQSSMEDLAKKQSRFLVVPSFHRPDDLESVVSADSEDNECLSFTPERRNSLGRRNAFCSLQQAAEMAQQTDDDDNHSFASRVAHSTIHAHGNNYHSVMKNYLKQAKKYIFNMHIGNAKKDERQLFQYDLQDEERKEWEAVMLDEEFVFGDDNIDQAPFQLVKKTSLYKIHSIFSMLQLSKAYVTDCGRLIGVVALSDLRRELEKTQSREKEIVEKKKEDTRKETPSSMVYDILTPTLEIVRPIIESPDIMKESDLEMCAEVKSLESFRKASSISSRHRPVDIPASPQGERNAAGDLLNSERLVQAVAYLRRKSSVYDRRASMR